MLDVTFPEHTTFPAICPTRICYYFYFSYHVQSYICTLASSSMSENWRNTVVASFQPTLNVYSEMSQYFGSPRQVVHHKMPCKHLFSFAIKLIFFCKIEVLSPCLKIYVIRQQTTVRNNAPHKWDAHYISSSLAHVCTTIYNNIV